MGSGLNEKSLFGFPLIGACMFHASGGMGTLGNLLQWTIGTGKSLRPLTVSLQSLAIDLLTAFARL